MRFTSTFKLCGIPLIEIRSGFPLNHDGSRPTAKGWIAIGDVAVGVLFSVGGVAVGGVAVGGVAIGVIPVGGVSVGLLALGGAAIGVWSVGGFALGLHAALGGIALAFAYAQGGLAIAQNANNPATQAFFSQGHALSSFQDLLSHSWWLLLLLLLPIWDYILRKRRNITQ